MKKLHPKISEFRRVYSAPEISRKVMEKCGPRANLGIDLSRIRSTIAAEVYGTMEEDMKGIIEFNKVRSEKLNEEGQFGEWEPIRVLKTRFREFEKKNSTVEIFAGFKNNEIVEKVKSSLEPVATITHSPSDPVLLGVPLVLKGFVPGANSPKITLILNQRISWRQALQISSSIFPYSSWGVASIRLRTEATTEM
ncbi:hypothetical protein GOBAR_DD25912 [Gossypium barbadense]|nr:hypothetical protein GOBAR_DD25912 [Gossypium barbadense]